MCRLVEAVHILLMRFHINVWFEFVHSGDNWADGISRKGFQDQLVLQLGCRCSALVQECFWWDVDFVSLWGPY